MKNGSKPMRVTSFMLPNEMIDRLGKDAAAHGVSKSALLRRLLVVAYRHPTEIGEPTVTHTREYIS